MPATEAIDVIKTFKDVITKMSVANSGSRVWWYTWLASRDRFNAALWRRLCVLQSLANSTKNQKIDDPVISEYRSRTNNHAKRARFSNLLKWHFYKLFRFIKTSRRLAAEFVWFVRWRLAEKIPSQHIKADVVVVTQLSANSFPSGQFRDSYFGGLHSYLKNGGERVVICGIMQGSPSKVISLRNKSEIKRVEAITSFGAFLKVSDFWFALKETLFHDIKIIDFPLPLGGLINRFIADDIIHAMPDIFHGLLIERAAWRMLNHYSSARVIHIYENNPWEHAIDSQATQLSRKTIGFLHCAVLPSHLKNSIAEEEVGIRPAPDRIICTGTESRDIFLSLGAHDPDRVIAGCDLRVALPRHLRPRTRHQNRVRTALVILEGLPSMAGLLLFLDTASKEFSDITFKVREHPTLPLKEISQKAGVSIGPPGALIKSTEADLYASIEAADIVIYQSTTAAMTAVYLGVPSIKIDSDEGIEDDPLYKSSSLKWRAKNLSELRSAIKSISDMDQASYIQRRDQARAYVENYLAVPTDENMSVFLQVNGNSR